MSVFNDIVITHIDDVFMVPSGKGRFVNMEHRVDYGLSFCKSGQITYTQNGTPTVSNKECAVILPQGGSYKLYGDEAGVFPLINFRTADPFTDSFIKIPLQSPEVYIKDVERIQALLSKGEQAQAFSVLYKIFARLSAEGKELSLLAPAIKFMEENLGNEELKNSDIAAAMNVSEVWFRRLFKEKYGISPHAYLISLRIEKAKRLLSDGRLTVTKIAEDCGFSGVYHFCKAFKDKTGLTPTEYRKSLMVLEL